MKRLPVQVFDYFKKHQWLPIAIAVLLFLVFGFLAFQLQIENDISKLIPGDSSLKKINELQANSGLYDKIIFKIKSQQEDDAALYDAADFLEEKIYEQLDTNIKELKLHIDETVFFDVYETLADNIPCFLEADNYAQIDSFFEGDNLEQKLKNNAALLNTISGIGAKKMLASDPLGLALTPLKKMQSLQVDERIELNNGYLFTDEGKSVMAFLTLKDSAQAQEGDEIVARLQKIEREIEHKFPELKVFAFGGLLMVNSNKTQLQKDTKLTVSLTIIGIVLLTFIFFRKKRSPFLMLLPAAFGLLFALAGVYLIQGSISGISLGAGSVILGITINYSLHFFTSLKFSHNIKQTVDELWMPLTLGSFTTIASFFALVFLSSPILHDFGLFAGLTLCGAVIFTLFLLPQFSSQNIGTTPSGEFKFLNLKPSSQKRFNTIAFLVVVVLTALFSTQISKVSFESDLNEFNFTDAKLKAAEKEILWLQNDTSKTVFIAASSNNFQTALQQNEALAAVLDSFENKGYVTKFSSFSAVLPSVQTQQQRIDFWNQYWTKEKKQEFIQKLENSFEKAGFSQAFFAEAERNLFKEYTPLNEEAQAQMIHTFGSGLLVQKEDVNIVFSSVTVEKSQREKVYATLQKLSGIVLLDKQLISNALASVLYKDFNDIFTYTIFIVSIALLLGYGRLELALITFIPMLISWVWILGIMGFAGIQFNLINIVISTFIFGLGDDFSIFISDGLIEKYKDGKPHLQKHRLSILLCAIATLLGLGMLYFGKHPALKSIAAVSIIGIVSVYLIGQIVQPVLFNYFVQNRKEKGLAPWTWRTLALAILSFSYFVITGFVLTFIGFVLLYAMPFVAKRKRKLWYHYLLCMFVKSLVYLMANTRKVHIDKQNMDFEKPAIIVANHSSFLDILVVAMQHPKLILLTNKWVYHSPFFGKVVQLADYYPVMEGVNPAIEKFEKIIAEGYSIAVFPEGTRSPDGKLKRFHKGAFYLAEKLNLDIAPLVLHGIHDTMQKGDFMLFDGTMTMKFLPRISPQNTDFGTTYTERTKATFKLFKTELALLKSEIETPQYFAQKFISNYLYKGIDIERAAKKFIRKTALINAVDKHLPATGNILEIASGFSFFTYILFLLQNERIIIAVEEDEEQLVVAANCYLSNPQLSFENSVAAVGNKAFDAVILHQKSDWELLKNIKTTRILLIQKSDETLKKSDSTAWQSLGIFDGYEILKTTHTL